MKVRTLKRRHDARALHQMKVAARYWAGVWSDIDAWEPAEDWSDEPCWHCHGDGMDPDCDYVIPCPICQGEQRP